MLHTTYEKVMGLFREHQGYMSFSELKNSSVTIKQLKELEASGTVERFSRGWYWSDVLGAGKPADYRYLELGLVLPEAVICGPSACYLNGILETEPEVVTYLTGYESRRKVEFSFPTQKFYRDLAELKAGTQISACQREAGTYRYLNLQEAVRDCIHHRNRIDGTVYTQVLEWCSSHREDQFKRLAAYADRLQNM